MISLNIGLLLIIFTAWQLDIVDLDHEIEVKFHEKYPDYRIDNYSFWNTNFRCAKWNECAKDDVEI